MERKFFLADAKGKILGRFATKIASILRGKHKPSFSPDKDTGDFVVVINAKDIRLTGKKANQKFYFRHSGYPGGDKKIPYLKMLQLDPCQIIKHAVKGMLPKNKLRSRMMNRLKVFPGPEHNLAKKIELLNL